MLYILSYFSILGIDYWRVLLLTAGILLVFSAHKLSTNALFYYITGVSLGICASFLILVYVMSKLLPKVRYLCDIFLFLFSCHPLQFNVI